ncbi:hypothetical protein SAMN05421507_119134 [Lentzea jiangxiensis]|uniref:Uncharacterized protein n=1 Tax=Lentzea jiangxiensis TaxID=641025 RepID=A0A1H0WHP7_9PSEU|nr:hypothetical protein SAMN05421507_119134 [Lentzea jiangxiensis]
MLLTLVVDNPGVGGGLLQQPLMRGLARVFLRALQRRFVEEIDAVSARVTTVVELPTSHSPILSAPDDLAAAQILPVPAPWVTSVFTFAGVSRV